MPAVELAYETFGERSDPPVLLIMGLGTQMLGRPDELCRLLAGHGLHVIRCDNRDVAGYRVVGSPGFPFDDDAVRDRAGRAYDRAYDPAGVARQLVAVFASGDRTARLRALRVPALVIHGADDPLVHVSGGRATAAAIPGAELVVLDGMGHDLPRELWSELAGRIGGLVERVERRRMLG
jgi:pimeloyl-ACP methyl ester carboxylesterase